MLSFAHFSTGDYRRNVVGHLPTGNIDLINNTEEIINSVNQIACPLLSSIHLYANKFYQVNLDMLSINTKCSVQIQICRNQLLGPRIL